MPPASQEASFITFYSFKGGVGRSMAVTNTASMLAYRGFSILVIDLDLEAPGISYLCQDPYDGLRTEDQSPQSPQKGFVDLLTNAKNKGDKADIFTLTVDELSERYTYLYQLPTSSGDSPAGPIRIMPAGAFDGHYAQRFDELDLHGLYQQGIGEPLIRSFKKIIANSGLYDYVLVDSRTGFSDEAGICTRDLADFLVILSGLNRQNVEGTAEFLRALRNLNSQPKPFQIILSPVPNSEDILVDERESIAKKRFEEAWGSKIDISLQIPYHPRLALTEEPHIFLRRRGYLFEAYRNIESSILKALGHTAGILSDNATELIQAGKYADALKKAKKMLRLEKGESTLFLLAVSIVQPRRSRSTSAEPQQKRTQNIKLQDIYKDPTGRELIALIANNIKAGDARGPLELFMLQLADLDLGLAEIIYKKFAEQSPTTRNLREYARFLSDKKKDYRTAARYLYLATKSEPTNAYLYSDYGQILVANGLIAEGRNMLFNSWLLLHPEDVPNRAEVCYSIWLSSLIMRNGYQKWEKIFKYFIINKFERYEWSFEPMLRQAKLVLSSEEFSYATALAEAFMNAQKVKALARSFRWVEIIEQAPSPSDRTDLPDVTKLGIYEFVFDDSSKGTPDIPT